MTIDWSQERGRMGGRGREDGGGRGEGGERCYSSSPGGLLKEINGGDRIELDTEAK